MQVGFLISGKVLEKRGHIHIVSTGGATMVGAEGKILNLDPPDFLKMTFPGLNRSLFQGKVTFK